MHGVKRPIALGKTAPSLFILILRLTVVMIWKQCVLFIIYLNRHLLLLLLSFIVNINNHHSASLIVNYIRLINHCCVRLLLLTYLSSSSPVGHKATTIFRHKVLSLAEVWASPHDSPISISSAIIVCRHVIFGLFSLPFSRWYPSQCHFGDADSGLSQDVS